jgi:hypothetical protein
MRTISCAWLLLAVGTGPAFAASGPLRAPIGDGGALRELPHAGIHFNLHTAFGARRSPLTGRVMRGAYERTIQLADTTNCVIGLTASARLQRAKPTGPETRGGFVRREAGSTGAVRFYVGTSAGFPAAYAWQRAPRGLPRSRGRYVAYSMTLEPLLRGTSSDVACDHTTNAQSLYNEIKSVRVVYR